MRAGGGGIEVASGTPPPAAFSLKRTSLVPAAIALLALGLFLLVRSQSPAPSTARSPASRQTGGAAGAPDIFARPRLIAAAEYGMAEVRPLFAGRRFAEAEVLLTALVQKEPQVATNHYNLACAQVLQGKRDAAIASLRAAVEHGFHDAGHILADRDLATLRDHPEMPAILKLADDGRAAPPPTAPRRIVGGVAVAAPGNTQLFSTLGVLLSSFELDPQDPRKSAEAVRGGGRAGALVRQWQREGRAAGLLGLLYDNRDRGHSTLQREEFPQLSFIQYAEEARREGLDKGLQVRLLFNLPTLGNSSTAQTGGNLWRSLGRIPQTAPAALAVQMKQYFSNHLYVYPEHNDYDSGRNGAGGGWGDVFPAHTPYCLITRGSSGSDLPLLRALAMTIAAFRPETQRRLLETAMLMPTLQVILRRCQSPVRTEADYFTGRAHPVAFDVTQLEPERMVQMAQAMTPTEVPPLARVVVKEEDGARPGVDYPDATPAEVLFDTPCAVARVWHRAARSWRMVLNAESSVDLGQRPLTYRWVLLQGRPDLVEIVPLTPGGSVAELRVQWHDRFVVAEEDKLASNRVDIGVFAGNGGQWSAPAFATFFCPDSVTRRSDEAGRLSSIEYRSVAHGGNYADPLAHPPRDWRDELEYDSAGALLGWVRHRPGQPAEDFTTEGFLVVAKDALGRAIRAREVRYVPETTDLPGAPLRQVVTDLEHTFTYFSPEDRRGRRVEPPAAKPPPKTP